MDRDGHNFSDPKIGEKCILDLSLVYYTIKKFQILTKKILKTILHNVIQTKYLCSIILMYLNSKYNNIMINCKYPCDPCGQFLYL